MGVVMVIGTCKKYLGVENQITCASMPATGYR
jgi:hypothetical protein